MTPNPFDQGARYAAKLDPPGFLSWLVPSLRLPFHHWLDTRSLPFPGEPDRVCDTVAGLLESAPVPVWWALVVEWQTRLDAAMFGRLLEYLGRLWRELRPPDQPQERFAVTAAVVNLTGAGSTSRDMILGTTGLRTCLTVVERNFQEEDATATLEQVANGQVARCLLPFIPLMQGGADAGIIARWKALAEAEPDARRRADYAGLALVFADLTECRPVWKQALGGWNVEVSQQVLSWSGRRTRKNVDWHAVRLKRKWKPSCASCVIGSPLPCLPT
jgi:hypothetical protein